MKNKVKVYGTQMCPNCYLVKEILKENNIEFEDVDIIKNNVDIDELIKKSGFDGIPIIENNDKYLLPKDYGYDEDMILKFVSGEENE